MYVYYWNERTTVTFFLTINRFSSSDFLDFSTFLRRQREMSAETKASCPCCCQIFDSSAGCLRSVLQPCGHVLCHSCSEVALDIKMCPFCGNACRAVENLNPKYDLEQLQHDIQNVDLSKEKIDIVEAEFGDQIKMEDQTKYEDRTKYKDQTKSLDALMETPKNSRTLISGDGGDVILSSMKKTLQHNLSSLTSKIQYLEHMSFHEDSSFEASPILSSTTPSKRTRRTKSPPSTDQILEKSMRESINKSREEHLQIEFMKTIRNLELRHRAEIQALRKEMKQTPSTDQVNMMLRKQNENLRQSIKSMEMRLSEKITKEKQYKDAQSEIKELKLKLSMQNKTRHERNVKLNEKVRQLENDLIALRSYPSPKYEVKPSIPHSVRSADRSVNRLSSSPSSSPPKLLNRKVSMVQPGGVRREGRKWIAHYHTRNGEDHYVGTFETQAEAIYAYRRRQEYYRQKRIYEEEKNEDEELHSSPPRTPLYNEKKLLPPPSTQSRLSRKVIANALRNTKRVIEGSSIRRRDHIIDDNYDNDESGEYVATQEADIDTPEKILERLLEEARACSTSMGGGESGFAVE